VCVWQKWTVAKFPQSDSYNSHLVLGDKRREGGGGGGGYWKMANDRIRLVGWLVTPPQITACMNQQKTIVL
jgi:hypothetical protein